MKKHAIVPIFLPHAGCPGRCSFCDQHSLAGGGETPAPEEVRLIAEKSAQTLPRSSKPAQIAFFGGSFTAMNRSYIVSILQSVQSCIDNDTYNGIRISTRPDHIDKDILFMLKKYHVTDIELGVQSMSDAVLQANLRGHSATDAEVAACQIKEMGIHLGMHIMTGLYMDNTEHTEHTAHKIAELKPDYVRVHPTVVLRGTLLHRLMDSGLYVPQTLEDAVTECSRLLEFFTGRGIPVIRMGLHDSPELAEGFVAGPRHPAFREICESRVLLGKVLGSIEENGVPKGKILIAVQPGAVSKMVGQKRRNLESLEMMGYIAKVLPREEVGYLEAAVSPEVSLNASALS